MTTVIFIIFPYTVHLKRLLATKLNYDNNFTFLKNISFDG